MENFQGQPLPPGVNPVPNASSGSAQLYPPVSYAPHPMNTQHAGQPHVGQPHYSENGFLVNSPNVSLSSATIFYPHFQPSSQFVSSPCTFASQFPQNVNGQQSGVPQSLQPGNPCQPVISQQTLGVLNSFKSLNGIRHPPFENDGFTFTWRHPRVA